MKFIFNHRFRYILLLNKMKPIQLVSMTPNATFLFIDGNKPLQGIFEGINFNNSLLARHILKNYMGDSFQYKSSKNMNKIKCNNLQFYETLLKNRAATLNNSEFEQSKLFTPKQKQILLLCSTQVNEESIKKIQDSIVDYRKQREKINCLLSKLKIKEVQIEYLAEQILLSFKVENLINYVPIKLKNIDHYFQLVDQTHFAKFISEKKLLEVNFQNCKYNLAKNQYEIQATLPEQTESKIISEGWGTVALKNIHRINPKKFSQYRKLEQQAKNSHKGIFAKPFQILSLVYTKNNLVAVVEDIIEGYIFKIRTKNQQSIKIELTKIYCPLANQSGAFDCRQFARKNLIGKQVNVFLSKDQGLNILGSLVRFVDNKDIQTLMIQNGYGFVKQELKGTMFYAKLESLEKKAKQLKKGIHDEKKLSLNQFYEDFTAPYSKKQKLDKKNSMQSKHEYLRLAQIGDEAVVEKCVDAVTYVLRVDSHKKIIKVKLDGVSKIIANPRLEEVIQFQKQTQKYLYRNFYQRTVSLQLTQFNQVNNTFVGLLRHTTKGKQKLTFQEILLSQGLVALSSIDCYEQKWLQAERDAKKKKLGCWTEKLIHFVRNDILDQETRQFTGKFSWVQNGQIAFVQPTSVNDKLDRVYQLLSNKEELKPVKQQNLVPGYLCGALYLDQFCRARIVSVDAKSIVVKFIDWGNKQTVPYSAIRQIPNQLQYVPALCCQVQLDMVRPLKTKDADYLSRLRQYMMDLDCKFVKSHGNIVNVYVGQSHLNSTLIYDGYLKVDLKKIGDETVKKHLIQQTYKLRKQLVGIWEIQQDNSDVDENDY